MKKKVIVSDYDNTFYLNDEDMEKNKEAVRQFRNNGGIFVIATGRSNFDFCNKLNLYQFDYDYVIINHGATILDRENNIISNYPIKNEIIADLKEDLHIEKTKGGFCCSKLESRVDFNHKDLTKINVQYCSREEMENVRDRVINKYSDCINSYCVTNISFEIISKSIDKAKAIKLLINSLDISKEDTYVIGDGYSDINMIKEFKGYCMENSVLELKQLRLKKYGSVSCLIEDVMGEMR